MQNSQEQNFNNPAAETNAVRFFFKNGKIMAEVSNSRVIQALRKEYEKDYDQSLIMELDVIDTFPETFDDTEKYSE